MAPCAPHSNSVPRRGCLRNQQGYVLLWVLFSFIVMSALASAALRSASTSRRSAKVAKEWDRGMYIAEAGLNRTLPICADTLVDHLNPGDSLDLGWTTIGETGDRYRPVIHRIDNDEGDKMYLVTVEGRVSSRFGGTPSVSVVTTLASTMPAAAIAANGNLDIDAGPVTILGACAGVSVTGGLDVDGSTLITDGEIKTGPIGVGYENGGRILTSDGSEATPTTDADSSGVPLLSTADYCADADYVMRNGWVVRTGASADDAGTGFGQVSYPDSAFAGSGVAAAWAWNMDQNLYTVAGPSIAPGTMCVRGNVRISGEIATPTAPLDLTVIATGSIDMEGRASIRADHPERMLIMAGGDVRLAQSGANRFDGLIYARRHCWLVGSMAINGRIQCGTAPAPAEALVLYHENDISAELTLTSSCVGTGGVTRLRPIANRAWMQRY